eukprot:5101937-Pyramimonas_sp.AAC.1
MSGEKTHKEAGARLGRGECPLDPSGDKRTRRRVRAWGAGRTPSRPPLEPRPPHSAPGAYSQRCEGQGGGALATESDASGSS